MAKVTREETQKKIYLSVFVATATNDVEEKNQKKKSRRRS